MSLMPLLQAGGVTVIILVLCSVLSWTIALERLYYYLSRSGVKRAVWMSRISAELKEGDVGRALELSKNTDTPFAQVVYAGLMLVGRDEKAISNAMEREIAEETKKLERGHGIVGTIGSVTVYVGLFGTVLGVIKAFRDISASGSGGLNVVITGISEALICTAAGLAVAVPAVIAYNYFVKRVDGFVIDMELCASEVLDLVRDKRK